jgi:fibronectin-binding autotransporter adhesin
MKRLRTMMLFATVTVALALQGADKTWNDSSADFNNGAGWTGGLPGTGDAAVFPADADIVNQPNLTDDSTIQQLRFSVATSTNYMLTAGAGKKLTLTSKGSGVTAGTGAALVGVNNVGLNTVAAPIVLGAAAGSTQSFRATASGMLIVSGDVSEANGGITLGVEGSTAAGILRLSGSNSFSGGLVLNSGTLELGHPSAIPSVGTLVLGGGTLRSVDNTLRLFANPFTLGGTVNFGGSTPANQGTLIFTNSGTLTADFTTTIASVNPSPVNGVAFEGVIGDYGSRGITVQGSTGGNGFGYLFLFGANTYSGKTVINTSGSAGPVVINTIGNSGETASSLGAPTGAVRVIEIATGGPNQSSSGGILRYIGGPASTDRPISLGYPGAGIQANTATLDASGYGALIWAGDLIAQGTSTGVKNLRLDGVSSDTNTFAGNLPDNSFTGTGKLNLTKNGAGTWILKGSNTFSGGITISKGKLVFDYATNAPLAGSANTLTMGGATLALKAKNGNASVQILGTLSTSDHTLNRIELEPNGGTMALTLGNTWTRGSGAGLTLGLPSGAELIASPALANDLLHYAVVRDDTTIGFATTNAAGRIVRYAYAPSQQLTANPGFSNTTNLYLTNSLIMTGGSTLGYTLDVDTRDGGSLDLGGSARSLNSGAWLFHGAGAFAISNGVLSGGSSASETMIHQHADGVVLISTWGTANNNLAKTGPGTLAIGYKAGAGYLRCLEGAVRADHVTVLTNYTTTATRFIILNGGVLELGASGDLSNTLGAASGNLQFLGDGGFSAYGATRTVRLNNGNASLDWGGANFVPANNALLLGGPDANALIDFQNGLAFGYQQRLVRVANGSADVDARLSGVLSGGYGGGLIKEGAGALEITGASNSYRGETWVKAGALLVNNASGEGTGPGAVTVFSGGAIGGTGTVNRLTLRSGGRLLALGTPGGVSTLKVTGALNISAGTLDFSGLGSLPKSDLVLAEYGSLIGSAFASVTNLPAGRTVGYTATSIVLQGSAAGTVIMVR